MKKKHTSLCIRQSRYSSHELLYIFSNIHSVSRNGPVITIFTVDAHNLVNKFAITGDTCGLMVIKAELVSTDKRPSYRPMRTKDVIREIRNWGKKYGFKKYIHAKCGIIEYLFGTRSPRWTIDFSDRDKTLNV